LIEKEILKTIKTSTENFLSQKNITMIGVSYNPEKFGNTIYRSLKKKGYNVFPINRMQKRLKEIIIIPSYNHCQNFLMELL